MSAWRARGQAVPQLQAERGRIPWRRRHLVLGVLGGKGSQAAASWLCLSPISRSFPVIYPSLPGAGALKPSQAQPR